MSRVLVCLCLILFAGSASAADPKPACVCGDSCACKPGFCPSACPVIAVCNGERFGYESIILERKNGRTEIGVTIPDSWPPRVVPLGFSDAMRVLADNPFAGPCPGGKCPAGKRVVAVAGARVLAAPCSSAAPRRLGFFKRLRGR